MGVVLWSPHRRREGGREREGGGDVAIGLGRLSSGGTLCLPSTLWPPRKHCKRRRGRLLAHTSCGHLRSYKHMYDVSGNWDLPRSMAPTPPAQNRAVELFVLCFRIFGH